MLFSAQNKTRKEKSVHVVHKVFETKIMVSMCYFFVRKGTKKEERYRCNTQKEVRRRFPFVFSPMGKPTRMFSCVGGTGRDRTGHRGCEFDETDGTGHCGWNFDVTGRGRILNKSTGRDGTVGAP